MYNYKYNRERLSLVGEHYNGPDGDYFPELVPDEEYECTTCLYQKKYHNIMHMKAMIPTLEEGSPDRNALEDAVNSDVWALLSFGNAIAEQRCLGNAVALQALWN